MQQAQGIPTAERLKVAGRWIGVLPGAVLGSWAAYIIIRILQKWAATRYFDPDSFYMTLLVESISSSASGAAFIYLGTRIAPTYKKITAFTLSGLALVFLGFCVYPALFNRAYWSLWASACTLFGVVGTLYGMLKDGTLEELHTHEEQTSNPGQRLWK